MPSLDSLLGDQHDIGMAKYHGIDAMFSDDLDKNENLLRNLVRIWHQIRKFNGPRNACIGVETKSSGGC